MVPATKTYTDLVLDDGLTHDGSDVLVRHHRNAVFKQSPRGAQLAKETATSARKIDAAVCAVMAVEQAVSFAEEPGVEVFAF